MPSARACPGPEISWTPVNRDLAAVLLQRATERLHQRALARTVLAEQRVDLAASHLEIDASEGNDAGKLLANAAHVEHRRSTSWDDGKGKSR
jgi:hypothetical protein